MKPFIDREVERVNRNLLLGNLVVLALLMVTGVLASGYYHNYFGGPYSATLDQIAQAQGKPAHTFVKVQGELSDTGYAYILKTIDQYTNREKSRRVTATYLSLHEGMHTLLVKAPVGTHSSEIVGWLGAPKRVDEDVLAAVRRKGPNLAATLMPVVLDATETRTGGTVGLVAFGILLAVVLRNLRVWSSRRSRPETHPVWKRLRQFGEPRELASQLDMETRTGDVQRFKGGATVTPSWLVHKRTYGLGLVPLDRLAWIHKKVTKRKTAFVITLSKSFDAVLRDRDGGQITVRAPEREVDRLLGELTRREPWVLAGFSRELEKAWRSKRAEVIALVDARRQQQKAGDGLGGS